ncbi:unnamed protein product [Effrenium voratum]|uniref:Peroxisomal ATPase PEX1 N-terminal C-lobe domain-containing protein n=1 Tax=Effrenium voratum TaxID=2562239 RepID=A0AA36HZ87_9DINO|nr:unnamed protein product [Effrenium voratum]
MKLLVQFSERASCYVALHSSDAGELFKTSARHFCRCLRLQCAKGDVFVGWAGDHSLRQACLEISKPFAESLGLKEGEQVEAVAHAAPIASSVMVQPNRIEDWEVVELQAGFIEENLLSQVSVLMPGMIFPVWVHGQLVAKLQLDPADPNTSECFMLGRDTELAIESRQREREGVSMSADEEEEIFHLRVFGFDEDASMPLGLLRKEDLDSIAGGLSSCLMWLDAPCLERPTDQPETQLLRLTVDTKALVPPGHVILGASFAEWLGLPRFGLAKLRRCHQVPVFVPRVELVPCGPGWEGVSPSFREDTCWLRRRFESLVKAQGEVHLADGAPLLLRPEKDAEDVVKDSLAPTMASTCTVGSGSEADLYEGLSDIDDIYQQLLQVSLIWGRLSQQPRRQELPICADAECGVYEA